MEFFSKKTTILIKVTLVLPIIFLNVNTVYLLKIECDEILRMSEYE